MKNTLALIPLCVACNTETIKLYDAEDTVISRYSDKESSLLLEVEGDNSLDWENSLDKLICLKDSLGLDIDIHGNVVVTDKWDTFNAYFNVWQNIGEPIGYSGFTWESSKRGKQKLSNSDWVMVFHSPGIDNVTEALGHELIHLAEDYTHYHSDDIWDNLDKAVEECE